MILAIETATEICSTALVHRSSVLIERSLSERNIHSERLLSMIDEILREKNVSKTSLDAVAVSIGPGSFTGLRIGLSAAKGLAMALDLPIIAVPTLDGIAEAFRMDESITKTKPFCAMIDAKRDEAFFSFYTIEKNEISRVSDYSIKEKSEILHDAVKSDSSIVQPKITASAIGLLAERKRPDLQILDFSMLEPMYLRDFVATVAKNKV